MNIERVDDAKLLAISLRLFSAQMTEEGYAELTQRYIQCQDAGEKNRWLVIRLLSHPKTPMSVEQKAEMCRLSCSGVRKITRRHNTQGADRLANRQQLNPEGNRLVCRCQVRCISNQVFENLDGLEKVLVKRCQ